MKRQSEFERALLTVFNADYTAQILKAGRVSISIIDLKSIFNAGRRAERRKSQQWTSKFLAKSKLPPLADMLKAERRKITAKGLG